MWFRVHRKCKEIPPSFKKFFSSAQALTYVSLSGTKLPTEALKYEAAADTGHQGAMLHLYSLLCVCVCV